MASFKEIDSSALRALISTGQIRLVDVRTDEEVARGIIYGAIHIPLHELLLHPEEMEGTNPLIFYCHSGIRSSQACSYIASQGRDNVFNLRGGVLAWSATGNILVPKC